MAAPLVLNTLMRGFIVIMLLFVGCAAAQNDKTAPVSADHAPINAQPTDEASIDNSVPVYKLQGLKREELLELPQPDVRFMFGSEIRSLTDLSPSVKEVLDAHWKKALVYFYNDEFARPQSPRDLSERSLAWLKACDKTNLRLMQIEIAAPKGNRRMSYKEAQRTFGFLNRVAIHVIEKWKSINAKDYRAAL